MSDIKEVKPVKEVKTYLLDAVPMIGEVHAKKLLDHFGTISKIAQSTKNELMRVPGIGKRERKNYAIFISQQYSTEFSVLVLKNLSVSLSTK
jgi:ERCC4-type nuclease